jgi:isoquinoline 1-oxidoreductase beta subunit
VPAHPTGAKPALSPAPETPPGATRRGLLRLAAGSAFVLGFQISLGEGGRAAEAGAFAPNAFIRIDSEGEVTLIMPQVEMGQGAYTSISMVLA